MLDIPSDEGCDFVASGVKETVVSLAVAAAAAASAAVAASEERLLRCLSSKLIIAVPAAPARGATRNAKR